MLIHAHNIQLLINNVFMLNTFIEIHSEIISHYLQHILQYQIQEELVSVLVPQASLIVSFYKR